MDHHLEPGHPDFDSVDHLDSRSQLTLLRLGPDLAPLGEPAGLPPDPEAADQDASLLQLRDGRLLLAGFCWYPVAASYRKVIADRGGHCLGGPNTTGSLYLFWGGYVRWSDDGGRTWTPHRYLPPLPDEDWVLPGMRREFGGSVRGRPLEQPDGTVLLATYTTHRVTGRYASHLYASTDRGETWSHRSRIAFDPTGQYGYAEPSLVRLSDGRLLAVHRSFGLDDQLVVAASADGGGSWAAPEVVAVRGHPCDLEPLPDGRVCLVYGHRHKPFGIRARLWHPDRTSLADAPETVVRDDGASADLGYPWATRLADGRILVVYYFCDEKGIRHIAGSVLLATEE